MKAFMYSNFRFGLIGSLFLVLLQVGCSEREAQSSDVVTQAEPMPVEENVGWLHGNCIAIANDAIQSGTALTIIDLTETQGVKAASVMGKATSEESCYALLEDRRSVNESAEYSFYVVEGEGLEDLGLAIGVVDLAITPQIVDGRAYVDINGDGEDESFGQCSTSEGVQFSIYSGEGDGTATLWQGYYYVGYDTEATC